MVVQTHELDDPVEDEKGVVYEKSAIFDYLRRNRGTTVCPIAGEAFHDSALGCKLHILDST